MTLSAPFPPLGKGQHSLTASPARLPASLVPAVLELHVPDQVSVAVGLIRAERTPIRLEARVDPQVALQVVPFREHPSAQPALVPTVCGQRLCARQSAYAYRRCRRDYRRPCCNMCSCHVRLEPLQTKTQCSLYTPDQPCLLAPESRPHRMHRHSLTQ